EPKRGLEGYLGRRGFSSTVSEKGQLQPRPRVGGPEPERRVEMAARRVEITVKGASQDPRQTEVELRIARIPGKRALQVGFTRGSRGQVIRDRGARDRLPDARRAPKEQRCSE